MCVRVWCVLCVVLDSPKASIVCVYMCVHVVCCVFVCVCVCACARVCACVCGVRFTQGINQNSGMERLKMEQSVALIRGL